MKIKLNKKLLGQLVFSQRPVGIAANGSLVTENTPQGTTDYVLRDSDIKGFGVRVSPGSISFFVQRKMGGSTSVKRTMGTFPTLTVDEARRRAPVWLGMMSDGKDPLLEKKQRQQDSQKARESHARTFGVVFADFVEFKKDTSAKNTIRDRTTVENWMKNSSLWSAPFDDINIDKVESAIGKWFQLDEETKQPKKDLASGWKIYRYCRAAYGLEAAKRGISQNPFSLWRKAKNLPAVKKRKNFLPTGDQCGSDWLHCVAKLRDNESFHIGICADYLLCVLLWGGRRAEVQMLRWPDVDFDKKTVVFCDTNTKSGREHWFPLTPWAENILLARRQKNAQREKDASDWVFPSRNYGKHIVDPSAALKMANKASGLKIQIHDLRRTFATELAGETNMNMFVVKTAMNHAGNDVTADYIQTKIKLLRPTYEAREARLKNQAGMMDAPQAHDITKLLEALQAAAIDPSIRQTLLNALQ